MTTRSRLMLVGVALACGLGMVLVFGLKVGEVKAEVWPTPWFTIVYGHIYMPSGEPAPIGTLVQAITPRGDVAGEQVIETAGVLKFMHVYGEDSVPPIIPGFRDGEEIFLRVGNQYTQSIKLRWYNDWDIHYVVVRQQEVFEVFLPMVVSNH